jgi:hypothetical protein
MLGIRILMTATPSNPARLPWVSPHHPQPSPHPDPSEKLLRHDLGAATRPAIRRLGKLDTLVEIVDADGAPSLDLTDSGHYFTIKLSS